MVRLKELDVLRGIAALNVVVFHYTSKFRVNFGHNYPSKFDWNVGAHGVELFFMISGFVIFMSLQGDTSLEDFAYKRFSRLYPTYWICVCITFLIVNRSHDPKMITNSVSVLLENITMVEGVFGVKNIDGAYWSLVPELFFYVFMGGLFQLKLLKKMRIIALIWLTLMISNSLFTLPFGAYLLNLQYGMFFLAGILFYKLKFDGGNWREHILIGLCFLAGVVEKPTLISFGVYSTIFCLFYLFVYGKLKMLTWKPFVFLGYISYPLYLLHQNIGFVLMRKMGHYISNEFLVIIICIISMITIAWLVTRFLEKPILHFLRNYRFHKPGYSGSLQE